MQIDNTKNHQTFGAKFTNTETLHKVVDYAISKNKFNKLNTARKNIEKTDIKQYRLGSLTPHEIDDEFFEIVSNSQKFCPHFHLSIQSLCDKTLKNMNRHYKAQEVLDLIDKIKKQCPDATVLLRLRIDNSSAHVDLNKKFGAARENALALMQQAKEAGLDMAGIAFHVGSQTVSADPYLHALDIARELFEEAEAAGLKLRILDVGGGFPIPEPKVKFNLPEMLRQINARLDEDFADAEIWAEPGRYICGTAVNLITSVIGVTERGGQPWYFLNEGLYGTFSGVLFDQWDFKLISFREGEEKVAATFAGPSCDSLDIMFRGRLTVPLQVGDLLLVPSCGAYTSASATTFNGFSKAKFVIWERVKAEVEPVAAVGRVEMNQSVAQAVK